MSENPAKSCGKRLALPPQSSNLPLKVQSKSRLFNLHGDRQADLTVHGGPFKTVYGYPSEHYSYWPKQLTQADFPWGAFGENLTTEDLFEDQLHIGDRLRVDGASDGHAATHPLLQAHDPLRS